MTTKLQDLIIFEYSPKNLEDGFSAETLKIKNGILEEIEASKILDQNYFDIKNIIILLTKNLHQGHDTFACKISIVSSSEDSDFIHEEEGKDYLANIRSCIKALIHFVRQKNNKNSDHSRNANIQSF